MLQNEFTTRTKVNVSAEEFEAINVVYMNSDLDKDEFCKVWCKMNASRVREAKTEALRAAIKINRKEKAAEIYFLLMGYKSIVGAEEVLNKRQIDFLAQNEIEMRNTDVYGRTLIWNNFDIAYKVNQMFKIVA